MVQKIFYLIIGTFIYLYLFAAVAGSFNFQFGNEWDAISSHTLLVLGLIGGAIFLVALLLRIFWRWVKVMWEKAKQGAAILGDLRAYVKWVLFPQMGGYAAKVGVIMVFLAAYGIPVTFGSVMSVLGSNQLANLLSFTPGGVGVNRAFNTLPSTATRTRRPRPRTRSGSSSSRPRSTPGSRSSSSASSSVGAADRSSSRTRTGKPRRRRPT